MRRTTALRLLPAVGAGLLIVLALPAMALADTVDTAINSNGGVENTVGLNSLGLNTMWVIVAGMVVMFMQAGFMLLEIGFSRQKNAGTIVAKILTNFSIAAIMWYLIGFALAFGKEPGGLTGLIGGTGFLLRDFGDPAEAFPVMGIFNVTVEAKFFFQFVFCAVSLAIVWGSTLERIKFGVYIIYAIVFAGLIYPVGAHWVFGGGFLQAGDWLGTGIAGMQDFAGSTAVHLIGATGALAALLLLGPRKGKYGADGKPRAIPGHNMPLFGLARAHPLARLVRLQRRHRAERPGRTLRRDHHRHEPGRRLRRARRAVHVAGDAEDAGHRHGRQRRDRRPRRDHRPVGLRRAVGGACRSASSPACSSRPASWRSTRSSTIRSAC